jgi:hypothetical protein
MTFVIEEVGDTELGYCWDIKEIEGTSAKHLCQCETESAAKRVFNALEWVESMKEGKLSIPDAPKPRTRRKQAEWDIIFTPAPRKK